MRDRVRSYFQKSPVQAPRLISLVSRIRDVEWIVTGSEVEALLTEANLIKQHTPKYNVNLKDDKSFPYIVISGGHPWPQIAKHRGARNLPGEYFGPFASAGLSTTPSTRCNAPFRCAIVPTAPFASRTRPCLQYQIKRCTAPCVGRTQRGRLRRRRHQSGATRSRRPGADDGPVPRRRTAS